MRLPEYGREPPKRKEYGHQPDLLLVGGAGRKATHHACLGTQPIIRCRKLALPPTREGCQRLAQTLRHPLVKTRGQRLLSAMAPAGISGHALYARFQGYGYAVWLVHCPAVRNNRKTMQEGTSTTAATDAYSVFAWLRHGQVLLPGARAPELKAAYRLRPRPMALKQRRSPLRQALPQPTALRCLQTPPTPALSLSNSRPGLLERWQRRRHCGQWRADKVHTRYALAHDSMGLTAPYRLAAVASPALAQALADALANHPMSLDKGLALLGPRPACPLLWPLPRIGRPTAAAILTALGAISPSTNGPQLVPLAGLDLCLYASGARIRQLPTIAQVGRASLRSGRSHYAQRRVAYAPPCRAYHQRRKPLSPGKGAGQRALGAVAAKVLRMLYRLLTAQEAYTPTKDQMSAQDYAAQRKAA